MIQILYVAQALPAGLVTFFSGNECPQGWQVLPESQGRLILSVADPQEGGVTVENPLADQEDRIHIHGYQTTIVLPEKSVAAIDCCNNDGASNGNYPINSTFANSTSGYPFSQFLMCQLMDDNTDPVAEGTLSYFSPDAEACPSGWEPWSGADGRFLVPSFSSNGPVFSTSPALSSGANPVHTHSFLTQFSTEDLSYAGVDGCCNSNTAGQDTVIVSGTSDSASSNLPYLQLLTCLSTNSSLNSTFPSEALLFSMLQCPPGWALIDEISGRFLVSLPENGLPGASFGGDALAPTGRTNPSHVHSFADEFVAPSTGVGLATGCCGSGFVTAQTYDYEGEADAASVNLPYVMASLCGQVA